MAATGLLPAIERYDGPAFRVLRKYLRESPAQVPAVLILSAQFGLIDAKRPIPLYECRLSAADAAKQRPRVLKRAQRVLQSQPWSAVAICAGKEYRLALDGLAAFLPAGICLEVLAGGLGPRLAALRNWLCQLDAEDRQ